MPDLGLTHVALSANGSPGEYNWGGAGGTAFWVDPKEQMFVVFMMQSPSQRMRYRLDDASYSNDDRAH